MMIKTLREFDVPGLQSFKPGRVYVVEDVLGEQLIERMCAVKHVPIQSEQLTEKAQNNSRKK